MPESSEPKFPKNYPRREFLKDSGALFAAVALNGPSVLAGEFPRRRESLSSVTTEFGFNTHLHLNPWEGDNMTFAFFKRNVDKLSANGQSEIRLNLLNSDVVTKIDGSGVEFNEKNMAKFEEALKYAKSKGLKVNLVTFTPDTAADLSESDYLLATGHFYQELALRIGENVDLWQIFNEADVHDFKDYSFNKNLWRDPKYLAKLSEVIGEAVSSIRSANPRAKTTMNISHWVFDGQDLTQKGAHFFDNFARFLDVISLDLYPDSSKEDIARLPLYVQYFHNRYKKPVAVSELGMPTSRFSQDAQSAYMKAAIDSLKKGKVRPSSIIFYELTDEAGISDKNEASFGIADSKGWAKKGYASIMRSMRKS